jgi:hypothetical protein
MGEGSLHPRPENRGIRDPPHSLCIKFNNCPWTPESAQHTSSFGQAFDWRKRVTDLVGNDVKIRQLSYLDQLLYPDWSLSSREEIFTRSIAENLAKLINDCVITEGYSKDIIYINSHAPNEVCKNSYEHADHGITGNAVLRAIEILLKEKGIKEIYATWFTIYSPIDPKPGYSRVEINLPNDIKNKKSALCKACWETEFIAKDSGWPWAKGSTVWSEYPITPSDFEYDIERSYTAATIKSGA